MPLPPWAALALVEKIIAVAITLQTIEMLQLRKAWDDNGVWRWETIEGTLSDLPSWIRAIAGTLLRASGFRWLLAARLVCSATLFVYPHPFPHPILVCVLFATTLLISIRWGGTFNGGSDAMTIVVLTGLLIATALRNNSAATVAALWYIALQACLSYFNAGWVKIKKKSWRSGKALEEFLRFTNYGAPVSAKEALMRRPAAASWAVMVFECAFPLAFLNSSLALVFTAIGFAFHLTNWSIFGLNRFVFAWAATYPALLYCSQAFA